MGVPVISRYVDTPNCDGNMCSCVRLSDLISMSPQFSLAESLLCHVSDFQLLAGVLGLTFLLLAQLPVVHVRCSHLYLRKHLCHHWEDASCQSRNVPSQPVLPGPWCSADLVERSRQWLTFQCPATPCPQGSQRLVPSACKGPQESSSSSHQLSPCLSDRQSPGHPPPTSLFAIAHGLYRQDRLYSVFLLWT